MNNEFENNNLNKLPKITYGVLHLFGEEAINNVYNAIKCGFRSIDTAQSYFNEEDVGIAIKRAIDDKLITRDELFITTKLSAHRVNTYENTIKYINESLEKLNLDYIDMFLIHLPRMTPDDTWKKLNAEAWKAMEYMVECGKIKQIGVCNFMIHHLKELFKTAKIKPFVNQIEYSCQWQQREVVSYCKENNILVQGFYINAKKRLLKNDTILKISELYNKTPMQILLKYCLQNGVYPITRSSNIEHIKSNFNIFNFDISSEDMNTLNDLNSHPASANVGLPDDKYEVWVKTDKDSVNKILYEFKIKLFNLITICRIKIIDENKIIIYFLNFIPIIKTDLKFLRLHKRYKIEYKTIKKNPRVPKGFKLTPKY